MKLKHTPGEWGAINKFGTGLYKIVSGEQEICETKMPYGYDTPRPEVFEQGAANAKLIAAAPELLESLKQLYDFTLGKEDYLDNILNRAQSAIKKATE